MKSIYKKDVTVLLDEGVTKFEGDDGRFYYVYLIKFSNGNYYIGKHTTKRFDDGYCGSGVLLNREFSREKENAIKRICGFYKNEKEVNEAEELLISDKYKTDSKCLNFVKGGQGGFSDFMVRKSANLRKNKTLSEETKRKMSESQKGRKHTDETKEKISKWHKNFFLTEDGKKKKEKIANAQKGRKKNEDEIKRLSLAHKKLMSEKGKNYWTEDGYKKVIESLKKSKKHVWTDEEKEQARERSKNWALSHDMKHSEETKQKISKALKGRKKSKETIEKIRLSHIGTKASDETRMKMSNQRQGRNNSRYISNEIEMYDTEWNFIRIFFDAIDAKDYIVSNVNEKATTNEIFVACRTGKTRYGHKWKMKQRH